MRPPGSPSATSIWTSSYLKAFHAIQKLDLTPDFALSILVKSLTSEDFLDPHAPLWLATEH
jgi:hypothetical protein